MNEQIQRHNKAPAISIIMAAYNAEATISDAIQSVINQTYNNWELFVVDDCSTDNTLSVAKSFTDSRIRVFENDVNSGVSLTRKKGLENAKGKWIAVLDSDDMWAPDKLEKQVKLAKSTGGKLIFTGSAFMNEGGKRLNWQLHVPKVLTYRELLKQNLVSNSSVLVWKDLYQKYYAVGDNMHEDFAIWIGITKSGHKAYGIDEPLLIYRLSDSSKSSNKAQAAKMNWNTYRYVGLNPAEAFYYMCWYTVKGLMKYRHLK
jgi:teichuronic acid biosynthesis glycosyltransferase TuaG